MSRLNLDMGDRCRKYDNIIAPCYSVSIMTQEEALNILKTGANVFLTGEPGSGKTHTINKYVEYLRSSGIEPAVTASTGIAATHLGGMTIHSWSGIGIKKDLSPYEIEEISGKERLVRRIGGTSTLIIDEISMLDGRTLASVDLVCRAVRRSEEPFGGMQIILVGDFFQLPPVSRYGEEPAQFAFESKSWNLAKPIACYLSEQHRQEDAAYLEILSAIRRNSVSSAHRERLHKRRAVLDREDAHAGITKLFPHNADVDRINDTELSKLDGTTRNYEMESHGPSALTEQLTRGCLSPEKLSLKVGAKVMFTKNNFDAGFVNGTTGEVVGFDKSEGMPVVQTRSGAKIIAQPMEWAIEDGGRVLAKIIQIPLRLAWAITVHKSQGTSLDTAYIDLSQAFEYGQGYVALSRVRTLSGLFLGGLNDRALLVHGGVLTEDEQFRVMSDEANIGFGAMDKVELKKMHENFIRASGGVPGSGRKIKIKVKKGSTYDITKELVDKRMSLKEMAKEREMTVGTIISHLEKLVAEGKVDPHHDLAYLERNPRRFEKIKKALETVHKKTGEMRLSPAKDLLDQSFTFEEIRLARLFCGQKEAKK